MGVQCEQEQEKSGMSGRWERGREKPVPSEVSMEVSYMVGQQPNDGEGALEKKC